MEELHERYVKEFVELASEQGRKLPAKQQLIQFFQRTQSFLRYHREYGIFFGVVSVESPDSNERLSEQARNMLAAYSNVLAGIIRYGQIKTNEFRTDVEPLQAAHALLASYMGMVVYQNLFRETLQYDSFVSALDRLVTDGLDRRAP